MRCAAPLRRAGTHTLVVLYGPRIGSAPLSSAAPHPGHGSNRLCLACATDRIEADGTPQRKSTEEPMGTSITFKRPDGKEASGYLANAARGNAPCVVVIQEWWGLSEQIKGLCDRFAVAGFDAHAPALYQCTPALVDGFEKAMKEAGKSLELYRYDAEHAFVNEQRMAVRDREAAELAWGRATEFFKKHLG